MADWIPGREADFCELCKRWELLLGKEANAALYKWSAEEAAPVVAAIKTFLAARAAYRAADTTVNRITKDETKKAVLGAMRRFANMFIRYNENIPEAVKWELGIKTRDTVPTPTPAPVDQCETIVENTPNRFQHNVLAQNPVTKNRKKPAGVHGVKYAWKVGGERPRTAEDLTKSRFSRKTNFKVTHTEADKGKPAWYATRYENAKGQPGPWSQVVEMYIT